MPPGSTQPRVAMVVPRFLPFIGGLEQHVAEVAPRLASRGFAVTILTAVSDPRLREGALPRVETIGGVTVRRFQAYPHGADWNFCPSLLRVLFQERWDLIHCQGANNLLPACVGLSAIFARKPYVLSLHTGGSSSYLRRVLRPLQWRSQRWLVDGAAIVIGVSAFEVSEIRSASCARRANAVVIPNGIASVHEHEVVSDPTLVVSIGRLERYKGHHLLVEALPHLLLRRPDARLVLIGEGPYRSTLLDLARRLGVASRVAVESYGQDQRSKLFERIGSAGVVALLSSYESQGIAVLEALACRRRVLVSRSTALAELAELDGVDAIPPESSTADIADALDGALSLGPLQAPPALPTWDDCADQIASAYEQVLRNRSIGHRPPQ